MNAHYIILELLMIKYDKIIAVPGGGGGSGAYYPP